MARAIEQLRQVMEVCELGALTLPDQVDALMDAARAILQEVSTFTPPNEPLTLEQLREMDGEPAWWDDGEGSCWGIISVDNAGMWGGIPFFRGRWRQVNFKYNIEERKMRIYRRPPVGEA